MSETGSAGDELRDLAAKAAEFARQFGVPEETVRDGLNGAEQLAQEDDERGD